MCGFLLLCPWRSDNADPVATLSSRKVVLMRSRLLVSGLFGVLVCCFAACGSSEGDYASVLCDGGSGGSSSSSSTAATASSSSSSSGIAQACANKDSYSCGDDTFIWPMESWEPGPRYCFCACLNQDDCADAPNGLTECGILREPWSHNTVFPNGYPFVCKKIETCSDGISNQNEAGVDCGGGCDPCSNGQGCNGDSDCMSLHCDYNQPTNWRPGTCAP